MTDIKKCLQGEEELDDKIGATPADCQMVQSAYKKETGTEATYSAQKEQAITTLMNLQLAGFSEKEIN